MREDILHHFEAAEGVYVAPGEWSMMDTHIRSWI